MVMPLYDDNPFRLPVRPVMTWALIAINVLIFLLELGGGDGNTQLAVQALGVTPASLIGEVALPEQPMPLLTPFTYMFLHAGIGHIFGNMVFLWVFGDDVEEALGRWRFLALYLLSGIIAAIVFVISDPHAQAPLIGASGAIAGIVIAYVMLRPCAKITVLLFGIPMRISAYWVVGAFAALQFFNLGSVAKSDVAYWCHIGGMLAGGALFPFMRLPHVQLFQCLRGDEKPAGIADAKDAVEARGGRAR